MDASSPFVEADPSRRFVRIWLARFMPRPPLVSAAMQLGCMKVERRKQRAESVPHNLYSDANQEKRRKPYDHCHTGFSEYSSQAVRIAIAKENAHGDRRHSKNCGQNIPNVESVMGGRVRAQSNGYGNGSRAH